MKILIIDDNIAIQEIIGEILTEEGHEVKKVGAYSTALDVIETFQPDALILDSQIGEHDGIKLLDELDPASEIKVVVITKNRDLSVNNPFVTRVIQKPFKSSEILDAVRTIDEILENRLFKEKKFKFKLFSKSSEPEKAAEEKDDLNLKFGRSYVVFEEVPSMIYKVASSLVKSCDLMVVTTGKVKAVSDRFEGYDVKVVGISAKQRLGYMEMTKLGTLTNIMSEFVKEKNKPAIIFDDLEQMISINGLNSVLMMIHQVITSDTVTVAVSIDKGTLTEKDKELFLNDMEEYVY